MEKDVPEVKIKRQLLDNYLKGICNLKKQYGIYTIGISSTNGFHGRYLIQTDDVDIEFSKVFTEYLINIQHQNSQKANSIFTNDVFSLIHSYLSILETTEPERNSPIQTSRYTAVRRKIGIISEFLHAIRENLTSMLNKYITQHFKHDLQKILAWFIIHYFAHNFDLISQARKILDHKIQMTKLF